MKNTAIKTTGIKASVKKIIVFALLLATVFTAFFPAEAQAAGKNKTVTRTYRPMDSDCIFKKLSVYGQDSFQITYNPSTGKVVSVKASQKAAGLGTNMVERGGIRLKKKTAKTWTYEATWYLNFTVLPKPLQVIAKAAGMKVADLCSMGRFLVVKVTYTVRGNGTLGHSLSYRFQVPSRLQNLAKKVGRYFTAAF